MQAVLFRNNAIELVMPIRSTATDVVAPDPAAASVEGSAAERPEVTVRPADGS